MQFKLVTPERVLFEEGGVTSITLPTADGEITILPGHAALVSKLVAGVALVKHKDGSEEDVAVSGGFIEILRGDRITVLADTAERAEELSIEVIEQARQRAEKLMKEEVASSDVHYADAAAIMERELARYRAALRYAKKKGIRTGAKL